MKKYYKKLKVDVKIFGMKKILLLYLSCIALGDTLAQSNIVILKNKNEIVLAGKQVYFLEDITGKLIIDALLKPENQSKFQKNDKNIFARPSTQSVFWFKITFQNSTDTAAWLKIASTNAWYVDFYAPNDKNEYKNALKTGTFRPDEAKPHDVFSFWLPLNKASDSKQATYYIRIATEAPFEIPFQIGSFQALSESQRVGDFITAGFIGLMLIMLLYNLMLYFAIKDSLYLLYLGYLLWSMFVHPFTNNYPFIQYITNGLIPIDWWHRYFLLWSTWVCIFIGLFCTRYLDLKQKLPYINALIYFEIILIVPTYPILILIGIPVAYLSSSFQLFALLLFLTCLLSGYYSYFKGNKQARFYVLGWTFAVIGFMLMVLVINGVIPYNSLTRNINYLGISLEICMFSLALGDRFNTITKEKEAMQSENLHLMQAQNIDLEHKVQERTVEIQNQKEEIVTQAEALKTANQQLIDLDQFKQNMTSMIVHDLKNPLNALLNISSENNPNYTTQVKNYTRQMQHLVLNILDVQKFEEAQMNFNKNYHTLISLTEEAIQQVAFLSNQKNISIHIDAQDTVYVYVDKEMMIRVLINLLSNAIKYSLFNQNIEVKIHKEAEKCYLSITDFGTGIPAGQLDKVFDKFVQIEARSSNGMRSTGLGLTYCKMAIEAHEGSIGVLSDYGKGATFWFTLPLSVEQHEGATPPTTAIITKTVVSVEALTAADKAMLMPYVYRLEAVEVYYTSELEAILQDIPIDSNERTRYWGVRLREAIFLMNQLLYAQILQEIRS
jgi:signal transduction histidine kinase